MLREPLCLVHLRDDKSRSDSRHRYCVGATTRDHSRNTLRLILRKSNVTHRVWAYLRLNHRDNMWRVISQRGDTVTGWRVRKGRWPDEIKDDIQKGPRKEAEARESGAGREDTRLGDHVTLWVWRFPLDIACFPSLLPYHFSPVSIPVRGHCL